MIDSDAPNASSNLWDEAEYRGDWWLPDEPEARIPGILNIKKGEPSLFLMGMFRRTADAVLFPRGPGFRPDFIHGEATDGTKITLRRNIPIRQNFGFGPPHVKYSCEWAAIGDHFLDTATFSRMIISFSGANDWALASPLVEDHEGLSGSA